MEKVIRSLAKQAILDEFDKTQSIDTKMLLEKYPALAQQRATFVTLSLDGRLRGCIGSLVAHRTLLDDLIHNAKSAAFEDPRFYPLSSEEFKKVVIEISLLSPPEPLLYDSIEDLKSKVSVGIDGIILQKEGKRATFLPQVWEQLPTFEHFFSHLCQKAGLGANCLEHHPDIWRYRVEKIK